MKREGVEAREMDALLDEVLGGKAPPDLTDRVLGDCGPAGRRARDGLAHRPGEPARDDHARRLAPSWGAAAAAAVLASIGLLAILWFDSLGGGDRAGRGDPADAPEATRPDAPRIGATAPEDAPISYGVRDDEDFGAVPSNARAITLIDPDDARVRSLGRFPALSVLRITGVDRDIWGDPETRRLTAAGFEALTRLASLRHLDVRACPLDDAAIAAIARHPSLESLFLRVRVGLDAPAISDASLARLADLRSLRRLRIERGHDWITEAGIRALGRLTRLESLAVDQVRLRGSLALLAPLTALRNLSLSLTGVEDRDLEALAKLKRLEVLELAERSITDEGLKHVGTLSGLESLTLEGMLGVTDEGLAHLRALGVLHTLKLPACYRVTDDGVAALLEACPIRTLGLTAFSYHPNRRDIVYTLVGDRALAVAARTGVEAIDVSGRESVTDEGLAALGESPTLRALVLDRCENVTGAGIAHLGGARALERLGLESCYGVNDLALAALARLPALGHLDLGATMSAKNRDRWKDLTDAGCGHLGAMPALRTLSLRKRAYLTDDALERLARAPALVSLDLDGLGEITPAGFHALARVATLRRVSLRGITDGAFRESDFARFRRLRPACEIVMPNGRRYVPRSARPASDPAGVTVEPTSDPFLVARGIDAVYVVKDAATARMVPLAARAVRSLGPWTASRFGDEALAAVASRLKNLEYLDLSQSRITDRGLARVRRLEKLARLRLFDCAVTDAGVDHLAALPALRAVELGSRFESTDAVTDRSLATLGGLEGLEVLAVPFCWKITDRGLAHLRGSRSLRELTIDYLPEITDAGYRSLGTIRSLRKVSHRALRESRRITDDGLAALAGLPALEVLAVESCHLIRGDGLEAFRRHRRLRTLSLSMCTGVDDRALAHLAGVETLEALDLSQCGGVTDAGVEHLASLPRLRSLSLTRRGLGGLTDRGLRALARAPRLETLSIAYGKGVTDAGVVALAKVGRLRTVNLRACAGVGDAGAIALLERSPVETLILDSLPVTDAVLDVAAKCPTLMKLGLRFCERATPSAIRGLQRARPACRVLH